VDQTRFQEAQHAYDAADYRSAAKLFLAAAGGGADGNGAAYHMAGNALIRLRRYQDAITVYGHALRDSIYDKRGAVLANLGASYTALADYAEAVKAYEGALEEPDYATPYKAYQGMANALMERGRVEEAAISYRKAALDPGNPDPGKALVNLGLCFMALGRPADAVEAYQAALGFDDYSGRGKALANLGQAYVALGEYDEAVKSFEKATQLHSHQLSAPAAAAYATALAQARPERQVVDGWQTGEIPHVALPDDGSSALWATDEFAPATQEPSAPVLFDQADPEVSGLPPEADAAADELGFGDEAAVADFFTVTEEQLKERDRETRRQGRASAPSRKGGGARAAIVVVVLVVLVAALLGGAYALGLGWPTQQQTTTGLLTAHQTGGSVNGFWVAVPQKDVAKEMAKIPPLKSFAINGVDMHPQSSTVAVTVAPKNGAPLNYSITMSREGVGWKVTGVENDWSSTGTGN
jgi:tetratricopeptide (TPR) repeat protein